MIYLSSAVDVIFALLALLLSEPPELTYTGRVAEVHHEEVYLPERVTVHHLAVDVPGERLQLACLNSDKSGRCDLLTKQVDVTFWCASDEDDLVEEEQICVVARTR